MNYVLLIILFLTPPNNIKDSDKGTAKDHRVWVLQSATAIEVSSKDWCTLLAKSIDGTFGTTSTVTTRMFCIPKSEQALTSGAALKDFLKDKKPGVAECMVQNEITVGPNTSQPCN